MKNTIQIFTFLFAVFAFQANFGQDVHFSKFYDAPLILNPANTGNYEGNWRLINDYRQQGDQVSPYYTTTAVAFDHPVYIRNEKASLGLIYMHDNSAMFSFFSNKLYLSAAYFVKVSTFSYLHMGLQVGYVLNNLDQSKITFPDQFDMNTGYFNSDLATAEYLPQAHTNYFDLNWGLIWSRVSTKNKIEAGIGMFHYNSPNASFYDKGYKIHPKYLSHIYFQQKISEKYYIKPILLYAYQNKASELLSGITAGKRLNSLVFREVNIGVLYRGTFFRTQDALIAKLGVSYKDFQFSVAYDTAISHEKNLPFTGNAFEISITYNRPATDLSTKKIKCEIF